jgi:hypothetical protein
MTDTMLKRKAGRPPLRPAPQNAGDCRMLIAQETQAEVARPEKRMGNKMGIRNVAP